MATHRELLPDHLIDTVHFGDDDRAAALADTILRARRRTSAAWNGGIYHDFLATHRREEALRRCVERFPDGFGAAEAAIVGVGAPSLEQWRRDGYIVPI